MADQRRRKTSLSKDTKSMSAKLLEKMSQKELQAELRRLRVENASLKKGERLEEAKESINVKAEARIICELALLSLFHFMENSASNPLPFTVTTRRHCLVAQLFFSRKILFSLYRFRRFIIPVFLCV